MQRSDRAVEAASQYLMPGEQIVAAGFGSMGHVSVANQIATAVFWEVVSGGTLLRTKRARKMHYVVTDRRLLALDGESLLFGPGKLQLNLPFVNAKVVSSKQGTFGSHITELAIDGQPKPLRITFEGGHGDAAQQMVRAIETVGGGRAMAAGQQGYGQPALPAGGSQPDYGYGQPSTPPGYGSQPQQPQQPGYGSPQPTAYGVSPEPAAAYGNYGNYGSTPQPAGYGSNPQPAAYGASAEPAAAYGSNPQPAGYGVSPEPAAAYGNSPQPAAYGVSPDPAAAYGGNYGSTPQSAGYGSSPQPSAAYGGNYGNYGSSPQPQFQPPQPQFQPQQEQPQEQPQQPQFHPAQPQSAQPQSQPAQAQQQPWDQPPQPWQPPR